jgi:voltage-gated potassium channel
MSVLDCLYYSTVSLTTTGYGDIVPVSTSARAVNIVVNTPLRLGFILMLVATTLEVLTTTARANREPGDGGALCTTSSGPGWRGPRA